MPKKTTKTQEEPQSVEPSEEATQPSDVAPALSHPNAFSISLRALSTEGEILLNRLGYLEKKCDALEATNYTLQQIQDEREKVDEARGEVVEIICPSGKLEYTADSIPLQTMMETLAEVLAVLPANEVNTKLNNILVLL
ncbi:hypothetical protein [Siphonobacter curvatus]|uniref:Uncharacterized protein n=1 Tax=Siphonobacter curvatus TaxID=2094562 RepID=A0A2S7IR51_9BACT|nr:hypothetical protein [Siphonobacter curvatus]PQA60156.1 hypothetical protein C5O19_11215 [Siphonobacter curvatus]